MTYLPPRKCGRGSNAWPEELGHERSRSFALLAQMLIFGSWATMKAAQLPWKSHVVREPRTCAEALKTCCDPQTGLWPGWRQYPLPDTWVQTPSGDSRLQQLSSPHFSSSQVRPQTPQSKDKPFPLSPFRLPDPPKLVSIIQLLL